MNQSVLQISSQDVESKRSDKTDFAEQLGAMNKSWQILQGLVTEKVSQVLSAVHVSWKRQEQVHSVKKTHPTNSMATLGTQLLPKRPASEGSNSSSALFIILSMYPLLFEYFILFSFIKDAS